MNSQAGIEVSLEREFSVLEAFVEGAFRGISLGCIYFEEIEVLLTPTHHFELPFWTYDVKKYMPMIKTIATNYESICFYSVP